MTLGLYIHKESPIHSIPAGSKVLALLIGGTSIFFVQQFFVAIGVLIGVIALYLVAKIPMRVLIAQVRPILWIFLIVFLFQLVTRDAWFAGVVVTRFVVLILLASLVTLTTPVSAMIEAIEKGIRWVRVFGINPAKISLGLSLALRFIPVVAKIVSEVREAQRARGLEWSVIALALPVIIRTLKMADDVASAIDARGYDP